MQLDGVSSPGSCCTITAPSPRLATASSPLRSRRYGIDVDTAYTRCRAAQRFKGSPPERALGLISPIASLPFIRGRRIAERRAEAMHGDIRPPHAPQQHRKNHRRQRLLSLIGEHVIVRPPRARGRHRAVDRQSRARLRRRAGRDDHRQHPARRSRSGLLWSGRRHGQGRLTRTKQPPANPERFTVRGRSCHGSSIATV